VLLLALRSLRAPVAPREPRSTGKALSE
jgi:hypothetical protein